MKKYLVVFFLFTLALSAQENLLSNVDRYIETKQYVKAKNILLKTSAQEITRPIKERLGDVYSHLREWDSAIEVYKELVAAYPDNADYQFKYGGVVARKAQISSRLKALTLIGKIKSGFLNAAALDTNHIEARWGLLDVYTALPSLLGGSFSKAYGYANELKRISPIEGYFAFAYIYELDGKPEKADENLKKTFKYIDALENVKRNQLNYLVGKVCSDYNIKLDKGIAHLMEFIKNYSVKDGVPKSHGYYNLAKLYRLKKDRDNADFWIRKALTNDSSFQLAHEERKIIDML